MIGFPQVDLALGQRGQLPVDRLLGGCSSSLENAAMERTVRQKVPAERTSLRLKIVNAATYVGRMTKLADEAKRHACQGLHNGTVLAYGLRERCL